MAVAEGEARVRDEVGQAVRAAEQAGLAVVGEPLLGAVDGGLQGEGGGGAVLVLLEEGERDGEESGGPDEVERWPLKKIGGPDETESGSSAGPFQASGMARARPGAVLAGPASSRRGNGSA